MVLPRAHASPLLRILYRRSRRGRYIMAPHGQSRGNFFKVAPMPPQTQMQAQRTFTCQGQLHAERTLQTLHTRNTRAHARTHPPRHHMPAALRQHLLPFMRWGVGMIVSCAGGATGYFDSVFVMLARIHRHSYLNIHTPTCMQAPKLATASVQHDALPERPRCASQAPG